jgi:hypothetical protein
MQEPKTLRWRITKCSGNERNDRYRPADAFGPYRMLQFAQTGGRIIIAPILLIGACHVSCALAEAAKDDARAHRAMCVQVVSCGSKDGTMKEYPDPCAARRDGAAGIRPMAGDSCQRSGPALPAR